MKEGSNILQPAQNEMTYLVRMTEIINPLKKTPQCRKHKKLSQSELARLLNTNHSIIGKYERDEVKPTIDVVKKLAKVLNTTVSFLLGETEDRELLKAPSMLRRLNDIAKFPEEDKRCILYTIDAMINNVKLKSLQA